MGELRAGAEIDGFLLEERIHCGSMSTLWRVRGAASSGPMVMKIPLLREGDDPAGIVGFEVEQMILPTMSGIHVPRFIAAGDFAEQPYLVMEQISGSSLRSRLDEAPMPASEAASIGARVAAALHDVHSQDVIHLDLKPSNVMFRENGTAVLIDFGLARHDELPDLLAEEFRLPMGTGPYISPEQVLRIRNEPRSDLFALGVMLYLLMTGERPFGNPASIVGLRRRLYRDPAPPRARNPECPPWLQEVILRCLERNPNDRYDTAAQLSLDLQYPEQVELTARSRRSSRDGWGAVAKRWARSLGTTSDPTQSAAAQLARGPILLVAVDLAQGSDVLHTALALTARRIFHAAPSGRLACVTVQKTSRLGMDAGVDDEGRNLHVRKLVELKHWSLSLGIPPDRVTYHVLKAPDPGAAIVEFAHANHVDQIVIGSRGSSTLRRYVGSVSSEVVARAECTVTVVKAAERPDARVAASSSPECPR